MARFHETGHRPADRQSVSMKSTRPAIGALFYFGTALVLGLYFTFAAVQGSFGLFNRVQIEAEAAIEAAFRAGDL